MKNSQKATVSNWEENNSSKSSLNPQSALIQQPTNSKTAPQWWQKFTSKKIFFGVTILVFLSAVLILYQLATKNQLTTNNHVNQPTGISESPDFFDLNYSFAEYKLETTNFSPSLPNDSILATELTNLTNFESSQKTAFTSSQIAALNTDQFFFTQNLDQFYTNDPNSIVSRADDWTYLYGKIGGDEGIRQRKPENSVFISSDFLLHVYHRLLEKEFEYIEYEEFYPRLIKITDGLLNQSIANYGQLTDSNNRASYERIIAYFAVPKAILDAVTTEFSGTTLDDQKLDTQENALSELNKLQTKIPANSYDLAKKEIELVYDQSEVIKSPIFGDYSVVDGSVLLSDYSQYGPRSHYNKNSVLRAYFRAMMWYGRNNFLVISPELTRDAIQITLMFNQLNDQLQNWADIYLPTVFFVGQSDDLGLKEYQQVISDLQPSAITDQLVADVQNQLAQLPGPQIMSTVVFGEKIFETSKEELQAQTKGFRLMGQRFTPDAFIFTNLTQGDELSDSETGERLPSSTTALMVMASLGNQTAYPLVDDWISQNAPDSRQILNRRLTDLKQKFLTVPTEIWTQNIYWGWLDTIKSLFPNSADKTGYPSFMKNGSWDKKNLQTALGSWTELKHDTLLYAKQSYAEMGGGGFEGEIPPVPKGYVEPNIQFLDRLIALTQMSHEGLMEKKLLNSYFDGRNEKLIDSLKFFRQIAVKELQNEVISDDEFEQLRVQAGYLESVLAPLPNEQQIENNARSALIADVHTDAPNGQIMYEATGIPNYIYVAVKDVNGARLTKGLVFSYFEFNHLLGERLNDEKWRELNYSPNKGQLPTLPNWTTSLIK